MAGYPLFDEQQPPSNAFVVGRLARATAQLPGAALGAVNEKLWQPAVNYYGSAAKDLYAGASGAALPKMRVPAGTANAVALAAPGASARGGEDLSTVAPATGSVNTTTTTGSVNTDTRPYPNFDVTKRIMAGDSNGIDFGASYGGGGGGLPRFQQAPQMSISTGGMFAPDTQGRIDEYTERAGEAMKGRGIADMWRGRQYLKARSRLVRDSAETSIAQTARVNAGVGAFNANTNAMRAANEVPLAMMGDVTQRRGQDLRSSEAAMNDRTSRYGINVGADERRYATDTSAESSRRSAEMGFLPHMPDFELNMKRNAYIDKGDIESAHKLGTIGRTEPRTVAPRIDFHPQTGAMVISHPDGRVENKSLAVQKQEEAAAAVEANRLEKERLAAAKGK